MPGNNASNPTNELSDANLFKSYSYSGSDVSVYMEIPGGGTRLRIEEISTISFSIYRDKEQIRSLGSPYSRGYTRGYYTIAGTIIFTVLTQAVLTDFLKKINNGKSDMAYYTIDQLPPLNVFLVFSNEVGYMSRMGLYGVEFMNEGQVMSASDLITENSVNFMARYITPMSQFSGWGGTELEDHNIGDKDIEIATKQYAELRRRFL